MYYPILKNEKSIYLIKKIKSKSIHLILILSCTNLPSDLSIKSKKLK